MGNDTRQVNIAETVARVIMNGRKTVDTLYGRKNAQGIEDMVSTVHADELSRLRIKNERLREACRTLMVIREPIKIATGDSFEKRLARAESLARAALEGR